VVGRSLSHRMYANQSLRKPPRSAPGNAASATRHGKRCATRKLAELSSLWL
jgi:hypothetical protein